MIGKLTTRCSCELRHRLGQAYCLLRVLKMETACFSETLIAIYVLHSITAHKNKVILTAARRWDLGKPMSDGHHFKERALSLLPGRRRNDWNVYAIIHFTQYVTVTESKYCPLVTWLSFHLILSAPPKRRSISKRLHGGTSVKTGRQSPWWLRQ
jgi:hypothetical protein